MDAELEFAIQPSTTGKQLFDQVCVCLCVNLLVLFLFRISFFLVALSTLRSHCFKSLLIITVHLNAFLNISLSVANRQIYWQWKLG